jgi:hypothetical protein
VQRKMTVGLEDSLLFCSFTSKQISAHSSDTPKFGSLWEILFELYTIQVVRETERIGNSIE